MCTQLQLRVKTRKDQGLVFQSEPSYATLPSVGDGAHTQVHTRTHTHIHTLTSLHHPASHGELGGVVGCSFAPGLPGVLSHGDEMLSLFNSHLALSTFCDPLLEECTREKTGEEVTEA